jgi:hypothetical protein
MVCTSIFPMSTHTWGSLRAFQSSHDEIPAIDACQNFHLESDGALLPIKAVAVGVRIIRQIVLILLMHSSSTGSLVPMLFGLALARLVSDYNTIFPHVSMLYHCMLGVLKSFAHPVRCIATPARSFSKKVKIFTVQILKAKRSLAAKAFELPVSKAYVRYLIATTTP